MAKRRPGVRQDALTQEQGELLLRVVVDMVDADIEVSTITGYLHGFVCGALDTTWDIPFPERDADEDYASAWGKGFVHGRDARTEEEEAEEPQEE